MANYGQSSGNEDQHYFDVGGYDDDYLSDPIVTQYSQPTNYYTGSFGGYDDDDDIAEFSSEPGMRKYR